MTTICVAADHIFLDAGYRQPSMHRHFAKHILLPLEGDLTVEQGGKLALICKGIILAPNIPHTAACGEDRLLTFLIDQTGALSHGLDRLWLRGQAHAVLPPAVADGIQTAYSHLRQDHVKADYPGFSAAAFRLLGLERDTPAVTDGRVHRALAHILRAACIDGGTVSELCGEAGLSQSRFSHLFKEQTGVALNRYLALSKLRKAYQALLENGDITMAAMDAGFSSPSHFSASSRKFLGLAASELTGACQVYFFD